MSTIEVQQSDSTTGMTSAIEGVCDIGMASRDLKDSELEAGLTPTVIAMDGIAVVVNNDSPVERADQREREGHLHRRDHRLGRCSVTITEFEQGSESEKIRALLF